MGLSERIVDILATVCGALMFMIGGTQLFIIVLVWQKTGLFHIVIQSVSGFSTFLIGLLYLLWSLSKSISKHNVLPLFAIRCGVLFVIVTEGVSIGLLVLDKKGFCLTVTNCNRVDGMIFLVETGWSIFCNLNAIVISLGILAWVSTSSCVRSPSNSYDLSLDFTSNVSSSMNCEISLQWVYHEATNTTIPTYRSSDKELLFRNSTVVPITVTPPPRQISSKPRQTQTKQQFSLPNNSNSSNPEYMLRSTVNRLSTFGPRKSIYEIRQQPVKEPNMLTNCEVIGIRKNTSVPTLRQCQQKKLTIRTPVEQRFSTPLTSNKLMVPLHFDMLPLPSPPPSPPLPTPPPLPLPIPSLIPTPPPLPIAVTHNHENKLQNKNEIRDLFHKVNGRNSTADHKIYQKKYNKLSNIETTAKQPKFDEFTTNAKGRNISHQNHNYPKNTNQDFGCQSRALQMKPMPEQRKTFPERQSKRESHINVFTYKDSDSKTVTIDERQDSVRNSKMYPPGTMAPCLPQENKHQTCNSKISTPSDFSSPVSSLDSTSFSFLMNQANAALQSLLEIPSEEESWANKSLEI